MLYMRERRARKEVIFQNKTRSNDFCPAGRWQNNRDTNLTNLSLGRDRRNRKKGGKHGILARSTVPLKGKPRARWPITS